MAGTNKNYVLGKGKVYFDPQRDDGTFEGEIYLSQTTEFNFTMSGETLDHFDADEGINTLDEQVLTQVSLTGALATDDISMEKLNLFVLGAGKQTVAVASGSNLTANLTNVKLGRFYQIGVSAQFPQGARGITVSQITKGGTPVTASGNYTVDGALGRVYIEPDAAGILEDDDLVVTYSVAAGNRETVVSKDRQVRGALRFVSSNPVGGQRDFYFPLVNMAPDGDYALKGEEWQSMGFNFTALKKDSTTERVYIDGRAA